MAWKTGLAAFVGSLLLLPAGSAAPSVTGLHGFVRKGPITPVCYEGVPCDAPAANVLLVFTRTDGRAVRTRTRTTGFYRVTMPAGSWSVTSDVARPQSFAEKTIRLRAGIDGRVDFQIDTGRQ